MAQDLFDRDSPIEMSLNWPVDLAYILQAMIDQLRQDQLIDLIKQMDEHISDYDFTKELADHFKEELRKADVGEIIGELSTEDAENGD